MAKATEFFFHDKESFRAWLKRQVKTYYYLPVSQRYSLGHDTRHSHIKLGKKQLDNWVSYNWIAQCDRMKVHLEPSGSPYGTHYAFCFPVTKGYFEMEGITPDMTRNDLPG